MSLSRRAFVSLGLAGLLFMADGRPIAAAPSTHTLHVYKSPWCGCCGAWVEHMRGAGFRIRVTELEDLEPIKTKHGVERGLQSCHTALVDGYIIEGHVPAREVARLLKERPPATGLAVPGMPVGSPGMEQGSRQDSYQVILFSSTKKAVYARY